MFESLACPWRKAMLRRPTVSALLFSIAAAATAGGARDADRKENCEPIMSKNVQELKKEALAALGADAFRADLAPALPTQWPPPGGGIVFYVYRTESLPTGRRRLSVSGPSQRIVFASPDAGPAVESIQPVPVLGEEEQQRAWPRDFSAELERAEQALIDMVAGRRGPDDQRPALQAYATWLEHSPLMANDLERRAAPFLGWLQER